MTTNIKSAAEEIENKVREINKKQELLKDYISQLSSVAAIDEQIKELQEERKALVAADEECVALQEEIKALAKEFGQAAKFAAKNTSFKPAVVKAFFKAKVESEEKVEVVKKKGADFSFLQSQVQ